VNRGAGRGRLFGRFWKNSLQLRIFVLEKRRLMTNQELKITIHDLVNETDDPEILLSIHVLLKKLLSAKTDHNIAGYAPNGAPITDEELVASVLAADLDIQKGNGLSFSDMKKKYGVQ
jgi:hypothetical protein